ncbi:MAG: hypothetical protein ORN23_04535 [Chthoniobacterales bacterium]|nr:hypothetical protein [Chthoniobacterales bacterium]
MTRISAGFLLLLAGAAASLSAEESMWSALTQQQHAQLLAGKQVVLEEEISGKPWPRFTIYHLVKGTPADVAAIFWDCELDPKYIPDCLSVRIISRSAPWIHDGEYTLKMPLFLPDEVYVSRNELKRHSATSYEISWKVLRSRYSESCSGSLRMQEHDGKTLLCYSNLIVPGSRIARLLRSTAGNQVVSSVQALVRQIASEIEMRPQLLEQQLHSLEHALETAK